VGQIYVANLTMDELLSVMRSRLSRSYSGIASGTLRFSLSVTGLRSAQVFVLGDVVKPGSYRVSSLGTALTALYAAGGPSRNGSMRRVVIRRAGRVVDTLDIYDYLLRGDASHDPRLQNGDVVFVPVHGPRVRIAGEVIRPATYEMKRGETLAQLIASAGGFTETASRRRVQIERILPPGDRVGEGRSRVVLDVTSDALATGNGPSMPLEPGDVVHVFSISGRMANRVFVRGNVWHPGSLGYTPGMRLSEAIKAAGGPKPDVYLGRVLVTRVNPDSTRVQLRTSLRDTTGTPVDDIALQEDDEVHLFGVRDFRAERYVAIAGAVRSAGRFRYREGMTLRDLTLLAGGLTEDAHLEQAEIARLPEEKSEMQTAVTMRVPLDSSYIMELSMNGIRPTAPDVKLEPYDNVLIMSEPTFIVPRTVTLTGEVRFPGRYTLKSRTERLTEVIDRAGGLTNEAYPEGVVFYRRSDKIGRIGIDLPRALKSRSHRDNLILQDADSVHVPIYKAVVNVTGAVHAPLAVAYTPGKSVDYYIAAAGGATRAGDAGRSYVMQPNGKVESSHKLPLLPDLKPEPRGGSTVFVPPRDPGDTINYLSFISTLASTIAAAVTTYVLVRNTR
jgi:polysaccharide biosynthesis/export protein